MFCKNCGNELREGNKFCTNCGTPVEDTILVSQSPVNEVVSPVGDVNNYQTMASGNVINNNYQTMGNEVPVVNNPTDNNMMNNQNQIMGEVINNGVSPMNHDVMNSTYMNNAPVNNYGPMPNNMASPVMPDPSNNGKNNKTAMIIVFAAAVIVLGIVAGIFFVNKNSSSKSNTNTTNSNNGTQVSEPTVDDSNKPIEPVSNANTVTYDGLSFTLPEGYQYTTESGLLDIYNYSEGLEFVIYTAKGSIAPYVANPNTLISELASQGISAQNAQVTTIEGIQYVMCEITYNNSNKIYFVTQLNDGMTAIAGYVNEINNRYYYAGFNTLSTIISNVKVTESSFSSKTDIINNDIDLDKSKINKE